MSDIVEQLVSYKNGKIEFVPENEGIVEVGFVAGPRVLGRVVGEDVFTNHLFFRSMKC